jgi:hypothetical protein
MRFGLSMEEKLLLSVNLRSLAVTLLSIGVAHASDWRLIDDAMGKDKKITSSMDMDSIREVKSGFRGVWVKTVFNTNEMTANSSSGGKKVVSHIMVHDTFDCAAKLVHVDALVTYYADGSNDTNNVGDGPGKWTNVAPDTVRDAEMHVVCHFLIK